VVQGEVAARHASAEGGEVVKVVGVVR
jgi:hypothetical protein